MWLVVTWCSSMSANIPSGDHLSMSTTGWPMCRALAVHMSTAVWYSGEPVMWTWPSSGCTPNMPWNPL